MSVQGYDRPMIIEAYSKVLPVEYTHLAAITIIAYDTLIVFHRERKYIYSGRQTLIKWIYILIKLAGITVLVVNFVAYKIPPQTPTVFGTAVVDCLFEVFDTAVIKTLLVLRLRALYPNNRLVAALLWIATAVELISALYAYVVTGLIFQQSIISPSPIPGCPLKKRNQLSYYRSPIVVWATRFASNVLELVLLLFGLQKSLKETRILSRRVGLSRIRRMAPILYVFYRDGTIFYIPVCALTMFGLVATLTDLTVEFTCSNWEAWLAITYYIAGTRLILNIREAGLDLSTSMITGQQISSIVFSSGGGGGGGGREEQGLSTIEEEGEEEEEEEEGEEEVGVSFE